MNPHPSSDDLVGYARSSDSMPAVRAASVEQHLLACGDCRRAVASAAPVEFALDSWARVADAIDHSSRGPLARALDRLLPARYARPVSATLGLQWAWLVSTVLLAAGAALLNRVAEKDAFFLSFAPLVPVAVVVILFAPAGEPGGEASYATPVFGLGLILRRLVAALVPALGALTLAAILIADLEVDSLVWLLPALGLASTTLVLSTYTAVPVAAGLASTGWVVTVVLAGPASRFALLEQWSGVDLFGVRGQVVAALWTAAAVLVISFRRERIATLEVAW